MSDETCEHIWQHDFCGAGITICTKCNYVQGAEKKYPSALQKEREKVRKLREALLEAEGQILQERHDLIVSSTNYGVIPPKLDEHMIPFIDEYDGILFRIKQALTDTE